MKVKLDAIRSRLQDSEAVVIILHPDGSGKVIKKDAGEEWKRPYGEVWRHSESFVNFLPYNIEKALITLFPPSPAPLFTEVE